jgi:polyphosphate kinase 2 (PPK2 family)
LKRLPVTRPQARVQCSSEGHALDALALLKRDHRTLNDLYYQKAMPERGRIAIFNRSYYEEVLVVRVHKDLLGTEGDSHANGRVWEERFEDINALERHLTRNGTLIVKFFLHVSKDEQLRRLRARIDDPAKNWKFSMNDVKERRYWDKYVTAYEKMLVATSTSWAPWYAIPSDHRWFMRTAIADALVRQLEKLNLAYPTADAAQKAMLESVREQLASER